MAGAREYQKYPVADVKFQGGVAGREPDVVASSYDFLRNEYRPPGKLPGGGVKKDRGVLGKAIDTLWDYLFGTKSVQDPVSSGWGAADEAQDEEARARVKADWQKKGFTK